jgi:hypothetical protein
MKGSGVRVPASASGGLQAFSRACVFAAPCVHFASVSRPGRRPAPSASNDGTTSCLRGFSAPALGRRPLLYRVSDRVRSERPRATHPSDVRLLFLEDLDQPRTGRLMASLTKSLSWSTVSAFLTDLQDAVGQASDGNLTFAPDPRANPESYRGRIRPRLHYSLGWLPVWARLTPHIASIINRVSSASLARRLPAMGGLTPHRAIPQFSSRTAVPRSRRARGFMSASALNRLTPATSSFSPTRSRGCFARRPPARRHVCWPNRATLDSAPTKRTPRMFRRSQ